MGAWIETSTLRKMLNDEDVAPYVGAWIETKNRVTRWTFGKSHPMWVRGLKLWIDDYCHYAM